MSPEPRGRVAVTASGRLRGVAADGLTIFRGVPYATPPVGDLRWRATRPHPGWRGVLDATEHGPVCPQPVEVPWAELQGTKGRDTSRLDEDCLTLTISTPAVDSGRRPVLVYFHGGGNVAGAGSWDVFSAANLARTGDLVAVGVNYRLGPLGYLYLDDDGEARGNWWLDDMLHALRWVRENIAAFGGDPDRVTAAGHSGGAMSVLTLMGIPEADGLFGRAILMGLPLGAAARDVADARSATRRYLDLLGVPSAAAARELPAGALLEAEATLTRELSDWNLWIPASCNVLDGVTIRHQPLAALETSWAAHVDVLLGWTREEYAMIGLPDVATRDATAEQVLDRVRTTFGDNAAEAYAEYAKARRGGQPVQILIDVLTDERYRMGCLDLADLRARQGHPAHVYQLDWQTGALDGLLGAPHCLELPFVFNNFDAWSDGLMVRGTDTPVRQGIADAMHAAWAAFITSGDPNHNGLPDWQPYVTERRTLLRFDEVTQPVDDLVGHWRRVWERLGGRQH